MVEGFRISKIRKRDGRIVEFAPEKITNAIYKAAQGVAIKEGKTTDKKAAEEICNKAITILEYQFTEKEVPTVEEAQDVVEKVLIKSGHAKTAKSYIIYRQQHAKLRETKDMLVDVGKTINSYMHQEDWKVRENSNEDYSFSGLLLYAAGKVIGNYALNEIYTPEIKDAHVKGYFHIHDLSNAVIGYCAGWSLKKLLKMGFGGIPNKVDCKPAKHLNTVIHQMVNYIGCLQMEFAGAQAFSSVDTLLAPFVKIDNLSYKETKQCIQQLIFSLNIPSRWGSQYPFSNLTFDWVMPSDMKDDKAIVGGVEQDFTYNECGKEMDMINKAFLEVMLEGDAKGRIFTFPIPTYNLTKDFDWDSDNANLLFEATAKYGLPYFMNYVGSDLDPKSIRAMCCRLNLDQNQLIKRPGGMWGPGDATGSVGVVTINLNRLGYEAKSKDEFFEKISYYMGLAKNSLEIKRVMVEKNLKNGLMPFTKIYLGTFKNHFSTIGLCGMNECCLNFVGKDLSTKEGTEFAVETLKFMRDKLVDFQQETNNLYNLEATPAESTAYRLARLDKKMYPDIITAGENEPYLTNSSQLPVDKTDNVIEAIEHQDKIQHLYTGGTIFHTFMGEKISSGEACKQLVKKIASNTQLPYFTITPTFSICNDHGYITGEHFKCPTCNSETEVYSRIVGYYRPVKQWNVGKKEEFKDRLEYTEEKALNEKMEVVVETDGTVCAEEHDFLSNNGSVVSRFRVFSLPNCDKCAAAKEYLAGTQVAGETVDLGSDEGLKEFRNVYKELKDKIHRNADGSLPIPTILLYDSDDKLVTVAHHVDQVKQIV
jgi:ribonucleoside-triphosphate reductase